MSRTPHDIPNGALRGAIWMLGAVVCFSLMAVAGRKISFALDTTEIMMYRSLVGLMTVTLFATLTGQLGTISRTAFGLHILRNLAHFTGQNLWLAAVISAPLAQVFALEFTSPIWALLLAPLITGDPIRRPAVVAASLGFAGALIVAQPFGEAPGDGIPQAAACAVAFGLTALLTRRLTRQTSVLNILFWLAATQSFFGLISSGYDGHISLPSMEHLPWLLVIAFGGLGAHLCMTSALRQAPAATVMPVDFLRLPLIAVLGAAFYGEPLSWAVFAGGALIICGNMFSLWRASRM